jgi:hypothetical protein
VPARNAIESPAKSITHHVKKEFTMAYKVPEQQSTGQENHVQSGLILNILFFFMRWQKQKT